MSSRKFTVDFLLNMFNDESIEVVEEPTTTQGSYFAGHLVFKIIEEFKFYKVEYKLTSHGVLFKDAISGEYSETNDINCVEVEPRLKQTVVYKEV